MNLYNDIKQWEEVSLFSLLLCLHVINKTCSSHLSSLVETNFLSMYLQTLHTEAEKFGGEILLEGEESLYDITKRMEGWTDCALKVFGRHRSEDGANYPDHALMMTMNLVGELISRT